MGNAVMADGASLPFVYLTNFLSESNFHAVLGQALSSHGATSEQTPHLVNLQNIETWSIGKNIESLYPLHCQRKLLKIKGGNILDFSDNRGMDYHQDSVPNKDYPDDPEIGFTPNASAVYRSSRRPYRSGLAVRTSVSAQTHRSSSQRPPRRCGLRC